jgi:MFS transporter, SHS family, lactate transporter
MAIATDASEFSVAWWREPTKDQWLAWIAGTFGWMLDGFDFTIFLLIMVPIAKEFGVSITAVASVLTFTLWLRLVGAVGSGWLADRVGRKAPLMLSILWFSACNFIAGFSPTFTFLFVVRALLGLGMGGEWAAGAALAMESWPARSRGLMGGVMQMSWNLGFALSSLAYWLLFDAIGWRGLLWLGILPAIAGAVVASFAPPAISYFATEQHMGFALPMLMGTLAGSASVIVALLISPETKGKVFVAELINL